MKEAPGSIIISFSGLLLMIVPCWNGVLFRSNTGLAGGFGLGGGIIGPGGSSSGASGGETGGVTGVWE